MPEEKPKRITVTLPSVWAAAMLEDNFYDLTGKQRTAAREAKKEITDAGYAFLRRGYSRERNVVGYSLHDPSSIAEEGYVRDYDLVLVENPAVTR